MKSFAEVVADLNAIKTERSSSARLVVPGAEQADENYRMIGELLADTGIDQGELAGISLSVASSAVNSIASVDGGIDPGEMMALVGSLWIDGVLCGARYMADRDFWGDLTIHDVAALPADEREKVFEQVQKDRQLYASDNGTSDSEAHGAQTRPGGPVDRQRAATDENQRGERDR